ncbi:hypothetical protein ABZ883_13415 [Streptomyces sp. NPDC046977]
MDARGPVEPRDCSCTAVICSGSSAYLGCKNPAMTITALSS